MSTATDIDAPGDPAGRRPAERPRPPSSWADVHRGHDRRRHEGGLLVSPNQINVVAEPRRRAPTQTISVTNTGSTPVTVQLSTRALDQRRSRRQSASFCLQPATPTAACPANTGDFPIWSGVTEVYQERDVHRPALAGAVAAQLRGRLPVHGPELPAARRAARAERHLRRLLAPAGPRRLRQGRGRQPAGRHVDGGVLHRAERGRGTSAPAGRCSGTRRPTRSRAATRSGRGT